MEFKSVIVHLPIDMTNVCNYSQNDSEAFSVDSVNKTIGNPYKACWNNEKYMFNDIHIYSENKQYKKVITIISPERYTNPQNDIEVYCWHCSCKIQNSICGIPESYDAEANQVKMKGLFCSFNCALTFNYYHLNENDDKKQERESLIHMIHKNSKDWKPGDVLKYAPPREALKIFGGYMLHDEFHNNRNIIEVNYDYLKPLDYFIEENILIEDNKQCVIDTKDNNLANFVQ